MNWFSFTHWCLSHYDFTPPEVLLAPGCAEAVLSTDSSCSVQSSEPHYHCRRSSVFEATTTALIKNLPSTSRLSAPTPRRNEGIYPSGPEASLLTEMRSRLTFPRVEWKHRGRTDLSILSHPATPAASSRTRKKKKKKSPVLLFLFPLRLDTDWLQAEW